MLRQTLARWLERKAARPVMSRAARGSKRPPVSVHAPPATAAAGAPLASSAPAATTGDYLVGSYSDADPMDDIPIEPFGRTSAAAAAPSATGTASAGAASGGAGKTTTAQEMLSRLEQKYHLGAAGTGGADGSPESAGKAAMRGAGRPAAATRRVMSTARRPHAATTGASPAEGDTADHREAAEDTGEEDEGVAGRHDASADEAHAEDTATDPPHDGPTPSDGAGLDGGLPGAAATPTEKSADAYRFLLNHIDAEIAALQRRHSAVTTRRQHVQTRQTQRIKELFELMESPWTLLGTEVPPALPATGVDVYIKEQQLARHQRQLQGNPAATAAADGQDKMYVLALHKNYKSMPAGRKRFYEEAAHFNAAVRDEMRYQLTRGSARFEAFLDRVKECTMEMAREGQMPELPSGHAHQRYALRRATASYAPSEKTAVDGDEADTPNHDEGTAAESEAAAADIAKDKGKKVRSAAKRVGRAGRKAGGKAKTPGTPARKATAAPKKDVASPAAKKTPSPAKKKSGGRGAKKPPGPAPSSRSIPLPNLDHLAIKKIRQIAAPPGKKRAAAKAGGKGKGTSGKKKKR